MTSRKKIQRRMDALSKLEVNFPSGLHFTLGELIRPDWEDFRRAMWHIHEMGVSANVVPYGVPPSLLQSGNREQLHWLVPSVVENSYKVYGTGLETLPSPDQYWRLTIVLWVIRCYWHYTMGGPKPEFRPTTVFRPAAERKAVPYTPTFKCPICERHYIPPKHYTKHETIMKYFVKWLVGHGNTYHKYSLPEYKG